MCQILYGGKLDFGLTSGCDLSSFLLFLPLSCCSCFLCHLLLVRRDQLAVFTEFCVGPRKIGTRFVALSEACDCDFGLLVEQIVAIVEVDFHGADVELHSTSARGYYL